NPQPNQSSQVTVFQQVSICITADGCAFYTIPIPLQPLLPFFFFKRTVFVLFCFFYAFFKVFLL
ncbi:hypothetical protein ABLU21_12150, partial [Acinetobacter soli]